MESSHTKQLTVDEQISKIEADLQQSLQVHIDNMKARAQRYYDCQDDYSSGGICDTVAKESMNELKRHANLRIEQLRNGGHLEFKTTQLCLFDLNSGEYLTDNTIHSKWGYAFRHNNKFIGCKTTQKYYTKKGLLVKLRHRVVHARWDGKTTKNNNLVLSNINVVDETFTELETVIDSSLIRSRSYIDYLVDIANTNS